MRVDISGIDWTGPIWAAMIGYGVYSLHGIHYALIAIGVVMMFHIATVK